MRSYMNYKLLTMLVCAFLFSLDAFAQVSVRGTVTDENSGEALPGVNVFIQQTQNGDATDIDGEFEITNVSSGSYTLVATFIGYNRYQTEIEIGNTDVNIDIELTASVTALQDVVVTAFGIQRESRALSYGVSEISAESIGRRSESDVVRSLSGKLPGVNITNTSGVTGTGTNFIVRGFTSITGSNQPLFVVDGVSFDGGQNDSGESFAIGGGPLTNPNRFLDIDPNNIEKVSVLRGLNATTLYGEQGRNGVVLITTKSGNLQSSDVSGFEVTFHQGVNAVQIASRPDYQDVYGNGFDQAFGWFFSNYGPRFDDTNPANFGPNFRGYDDDGTVLVEHPYSNNADLAEAFPDLAAGTYRYQPYDDPIDAFFRTGMGSTSSLNISGGTGDVRLNVNYSRNFEEGFTPGNDLTRNAFGVGVSYNISERLRSQTSFNMSLTDMKTPPLAAGGGSGPAAVGGTSSVFADVFYTPRSVDLAGLPSQDPITGGPAYYRAGNDIQNPFWTVDNNIITNISDRYFGRTELDYELFDGLNLVYRLGYDSYTENAEFRLNRGNVTNDDIAGGIYQTFKTKKTSWEHNVNLMYDSQLTEDFNLSGLVGFQFSDENWERDGIESQNQIIFDFFEHANFTDQSATNFFAGDIQSREQRQTAGVFGDFTLGYQDYVYLNLSARNDWFSTLEEENRSILYPAASVSFIVSDAFDITSDVLTYLKIYGGVGTSAGSPSPYSTRNTLGSNARAFVDRNNTVFTGNTTSKFLGNPNLKPELHTEFEYGVESRFYEGRIGLMVTYYDKTTTDLITQAPLDPSTGFTSTFVNIGEVENKGLEITATGTPLNSELRWDISANFYTDKSEVIELSDDLEEVQIGGGFNTRGNFAIPGETLGIMKGSIIERTSDGTPIVGSDGNYIQQSELGIIGDPNPQYTVGISNTFSFKGASLSFQFDYQKGGDVFSTWISTLLARGLIDETARVDRSNTFILPGVNSSGETNTVQIPVNGVFFDNFGFGTDEMRVYDATHVRLSELSLSYDLPLAIVDATPFNQVTLSLTGNNLWFFAPNVPEGSGFDPNVNSVGVGNARGFEYLTGPSARRFGGSIRVRF